MSTALPTTYGVYDAKTQLSSLVDRAFAGEILTITRHGKPVARLCPPEPRLRTREEAEAIIARWDAFREKYGEANLDMRELIGRDDH